MSEEQARALVSMLTQEQKIALLDMLKDIEAGRETK